MLVCVCRLFVCSVVVVVCVIAVAGWQFACGYAQISLLSAEAKAMQRAIAAAQLRAGVRTQDKQTAKRTDGNKKNECIKKLSPAKDKYSRENNNF